MLAVFYGNDLVKVRRQALDWAEKSAADAGFRTIESAGYEDGMLLALAQEMSLFGGRSVYVLDTPSEANSFFEAVVAGAESLRDSAHAFVLIEGPLLADPKKRLAKYAEVMEEYKAVGAERFNSFSLADALAKRDKKLLWMLWHEALRKRISPEEIAGVLWWQLKTLRLATIGRSADEVGLKDFPYQKAKRALSKFKAGELEDLSRSLLTLIHESRLGRQDIAVSLERWVLRL